MKRNPKSETGAGRALEIEASKLKEKLDNREDACKDNQS